MPRIAQESPKKGLLSLGSLKILNILLKKKIQILKNAHMMSVGGKVPPARFY